MIPPSATKRLLSAVSLLFISHLFCSFNVFLETILIANGIKPFPTARCGHTIVHKVTSSFKQVVVCNRFYCIIGKFDLPFTLYNLSPMQVFLPSFVHKAQEYSKHPLLKELLLPCHMRRAHPLALHPTLKWIITKLLARHLSLNDSKNDPSFHE